MGWPHLWADWLGLLVGCCAWGAMWFGSLVVGPGSGMGLRWLLKQQAAEL